ncbi:MAG: hypothetical protein D3905_16500, partial [Candidatus Electrothrix sp. AS4_5]|nr:hypothetical protein [Candidatus Electrothrix gigas]
LKKLSYTFELLRIRYLFNSSDSLKIDKSDSGFVNFYEISCLETDLTRQQEQAPVADKRQALKQEIVARLLEKQEDPEDLLAEMAENVYQQGLIREKLFLFFNKGELLPLKNGTSNRRKYLYYWACYDKTSNMPYIYLLEFEQDTEEEALHTSDRAFANFMKIIRSEGSRAPAVGIVAMAIDHRLESIHPKMLKRICIGPLYSHSFSVGLDSELQRFFEAGDEGRKFVFHITEQFVFSAGQSVIQDQKILGKMLAGKRVRERFYIPKATQIDEYAEFNELEKQKASLIRKTVVMPYKLHQHRQDLYTDCKIISFTKDGMINGV